VKTAFHVSEPQVNVRVSGLSESKARQLQKYLHLSKAEHAWGKDSKLLRSNLLLVPTAKNYTVLLALSRSRPS
jgi:hypothetical protein